MMLSVFLAVSERSVPCAWRSTALVSCGILLSERSYREAVTVLIKSLVIGMRQGNKW